MIGSSTSLSARWYSVAASTNCVSRNMRLPCLTRLRPSSCSQPTLQSTVHERSTTPSVAVRACALRRLMERATIHSGVGGINVLRALHTTPAVYYPAPCGGRHRDVTPPGTLQDMGLDCDYSRRNARVIE